MKTKRMTYIVPALIPIGIKINRKYCSNNSLDIKIIKIPDALENHRADLN